MNTMNTTNQSIKVIETKKKIKDAFMQLYNEKPITKITIREISNLAKINRGTFYAYYMDIYDLLEQIENEFYSEMIHKIRYIMVQLLKEYEEISVITMIEFLSENKETLRVLLGKDNETNFIKKVKSEVKKNLKSVLKLEISNKNTEIEYILEYITNGQLGILRYWLERDMEIDLLSLSNVIKASNLQGPITYLKKIST